MAKVLEGKFQSLVGTLKTLMRPVGNRTPGVSIPRRYAKNIKGNKTWDDLFFGFNPS